MQEIYPKILSSDMIVFASPIYYFTLSAQLQTAIHRILDDADDDCIDCGHCDSRCPFSVKQSERMQEIRSYMTMSI